MSITEEELGINVDKKYVEMYKYVWLLVDWPDY